MSVPQRFYLHMHTSSSLFQAGTWQGTSVYRYLQQSTGHLHWIHQLLTLCKQDSCIKLLTVLTKSKFMPSCLHLPQTCSACSYNNRQMIQTCVKPLPQDFRPARTNGSSVAVHELLKKCEMFHDGILLDHVANYNTYLFQGCIKNVSCITGQAF